MKRSFMQRLHNLPLLSFCHDTILVDFHQDRICSLNLLCACWSCAEIWRNQCLLLFPSENNCLVRIRIRSCLLGRRIVELQKTLSTQEKIWGSCSLWLRNTCSLWAESCSWVSRARLWRRKHVGKPSVADKIGGGNSSCKRWSLSSVLVGIGN